MAFINNEQQRATQLRKEKRKKTELIFIANTFAVSPNCFHKRKKTKRNPNNQCHWIWYERKVWQICCCCCVFFHFYRSISLRITLLLTIILSNDFLNWLKLLSNRRSIDSHTLMILSRKIIKWRKIENLGIWKLSRCKIYILKYYIIFQHRYDWPLKHFSEMSANEWKDKDKMKRIDDFKQLFYWHLSYQHGSNVRCVLKRAHAFDIFS